MDSLGRFTIIAGVAAMLLAGWNNSMILSLLSWGCIIYSYFRMFSRNIPARQREYYAFLKVWGPVQGWFRLQKRKFAERRLYRYFRCPKCRQQLRAPRGRGKIEVTCQRCRHVFQTKT